jgi:hypothetical protein
LLDASMSAFSVACDASNAVFRALMVAANALRQGSMPCQSKTKGHPTRPSSTTARPRTHGTTGQKPLEVFEKEERAALLALPPWPPPLLPARSARATLQ